MTTWSLNNPSPEVLGTEGANAMYLLKEALRATAGWTMMASGDGTAIYGGPGVDVLDTPAKFNVNGMWVLFSGPGGRQFLFGKKGSTNDLQYYFGYSRALGFTGGNATTYPTALDQGDVVGTVTVPTYLFSGGYGFTHIMVSGTTDNFYCFQTNTAAGLGNRLVLGGLFCDTLTATAVGDVDSAVVGTLYNSGADSFVYTGGLFGETIASAKRAYFQNSSLTYDFQLVGMLTMYGYGSTLMLYPSVDYGTYCDSYDGKIDEIPGMWARSSSSNSPPYGYKGVSSLFRLVGSPVSYGTLLNTDGAKSRIVIGQSRVSLPWDGSTIPLI